MPQKVVLTTLKNYSDERGNRITSEKQISDKIRITFNGSNNTVRISPDANIGSLTIQFDRDNASFEIGAGRNGKFSAWVMLGEDSGVKVGNDVSSNGPCVITAAEGASVTIGDDSMLAMENEIRADDSHPIFDVHTGKRANQSQSISIGEHVWLAKRAIVLAGSSIGSGSVLGFGAILAGKIPNNCVAVGVPARAVRRDVAWERPHLIVQPPAYKPDSSVIKTTRWWDLTNDLEVANSPEQARADDPSQPATLAFHHNGQDFAIDFASREEAQDWRGDTDFDDARIATKITAAEALRVLGRSDATEP
ncbi:acyltransferase [Arthrobacter sp. TmT3-37]